MEHQKKAAPGQSFSSLVGKRVVSFLGTVSGIFSFFIVLIVTADIAMRTMRFPVSGILEISRLTLAWICFASLVYTYKTGAHVRVTIFTDKLGNRGRAIAEAISCLFGAFLLLTLFFGSVPFFLESWKVKEVFNIDIDLPYWFAKLAVPVGSLIFGLVYLVDFFTAMSKAFAREH
jgi:TRAP-type C4-dicarboxylate transport system permease small subunit